MTAVRGSTPSGAVRAVQAADTDAAVRASCFGPLPPAVRDDLLARSALVHLRGGDVLHRAGLEPFMALVVAGVVRVYVESPDGRQATVRYAREGALLGVAAVLGGSVPAGVAAVGDAALLRLDPDVFRATCRANAEASWAVAREMAVLVTETVHELAEVDFATVQQRVVRHLLDLATRDADAPQLIARVTQQQLADAAGTVREVVARTVAQLRRSGLVSSVPGGIRLDDPAGLHRCTWTAANQG